MSSLVLRSPSIYSFVPRPHLRGEDLMTFGQSLRHHYFLGRNVPPPITLQKNTICTQWNAGNVWLASNPGFLFWIVSITRHTVSYIFFIKPKGSAECHQTVGVLVTPPIRAWVRSSVIMYTSTHLNSCLVAKQLLKMCPSNVYCCPWCEKGHMHHAAVSLFIMQNVEGNA